MRIKYFLLIFFLNFIFSSAKAQEKDFTEKLIDFVISNADNETVELENLYDKTTDIIPDDKDEKLVLAEKLKSRGFKVTDYGRGNYPPSGVRIVNLTLKKDNCECEVSKIYYLTTAESVFTRKEKIKCRRVGE